jgi:hypothetical protein
MISPKQPFFHISQIRNRMKFIKKAHLPGIEPACRGKTAIVFPPPWKSSKHSIFPFCFSFIFFSPFPVPSFLPSLPWPPPLFFGLS